MSKELVVTKCPDGPSAALYQVKYKGGSPVPNELSGTFTSPSIAQDAVSLHLANKQDKEDEIKRSAEAATRIKEEREQAEKEKADKIEATKRANGKNKSK